MILIFLLPGSETKLLFKEDFSEQEMIQEHLEEEREACVADVEEMRSNEEQQHQQQPLDQVMHCVFVLQS